MSIQPHLGGKRDPLPKLGATIQGEVVTFRVWAPGKQAELELYLPEGTRRVPMRAEGADGLLVATIDSVPSGTRYRYRVDGGDAYPDPCSRWQPEGVHGPSAVVDPAAFAWQDSEWLGLTTQSLVLYELHIGTFTTAGTFDGAIERLGYLRDLGVIAIELLPVAPAPGRRNWGYDGVSLYAPAENYGGPDGLRRLVDAAHRQHIGVLLDVVYNHLGPDGNYLRAFSPHYFTDRYSTPWGEAINYDGEGSRFVREYVLQNVEHWVREYHIDGFRLDATHAIFDTSTPHLLQELQQRARAAAAPRSIVVIAENDANDVRIVRPVERGGYGLDAVWADDFHHAVHTALTGEHEGYYEDYDGDAAAIASAISGGFLYQGQPSRRRGGSRGTRVTDEPASDFVFCLQNHDQVGNRAMGERLHHLVSPAEWRTVTALLLFAPETPLLFMGQEFSASAPFLFFTDFDEGLGHLVTEGRRAEFGGFSAFQDAALRERIPDPQAEATFLRSHLDWGETERHAGTLQLYRDLLQLRRADPVLTTTGRECTDATSPADRVVVVRRGSSTGARLLIANLGEASTIDLSALPFSGSQQRWSRLLLSTDEDSYLLPGEQSAPAVAPASPAVSQTVTIVAHTAVILATSL